MVFMTDFLMEDYSGAGGGFKTRVERSVGPG